MLQSPAGPAYNGGMEKAPTYSEVVNMMVPRFTGTIEEAYREHCILNGWEDAEGEE